MAHLGPNEREWLVAQVELKKYREKEEREEAEAAAERVAQVLRLISTLLSMTLSCMCPVCRYSRMRPLADGGRVGTAEGRRRTLVRPGALTSWAEVWRIIWSEK